MNQKFTFKSLKIPQYLKVPLRMVFLTTVMILIAQTSWGNHKMVKISATAALFQSTISGTVTDASGVVLPGASIIEKGTTNGTQSDFDGNYTIDVSANATLVISYVGFLTQEITVGNSSTVNVVLQEDANQLDEVVITGYSAQSTRDITGSVSTIKSENIAATAPTGIEQALQGQASGVVVGSQGGPGGSAAVRIRGFWYH